MSQNDSMQPKQTTDDIAGNQSEEIETDVFILIGKRVENDLNVYEDDVKLTNVMKLMIMTIMTLMKLMMMTINFAINSFCRKVRMRHMISLTQKKNGEYM